MILQQTSKILCFMLLQYLCVSSSVSFAMSDTPCHLIIEKAKPEFEMIETQGVFQPIIEVGPVKTFGKYARRYLDIKVAGEPEWSFRICEPSTSISNYHHVPKQWSKQPPDLFSLFKKEILVRIKPCIEGTCYDREKRIAQLNAIRIYQSGSTEFQGPTTNALFNEYIITTKKEEIVFGGNVRKIDLSFTAEKFQKGTVWASSLSKIAPVESSASYEDGLGLLLTVKNSSANPHGFELNGDLNFDWPISLAIPQIFLAPGEVQYIGVQINEPLRVNASGEIEYKCPLHDKHLGGKVRVKS